MQKAELAQYFQMLVLHTSCEFKSSLLPSYPLPAAHSCKRTTIAGIRLARGKKLDEKYAPRGDTHLMDHLTAHVQQDHGVQHGQDSQQILQHGLDS